MEVTLIFPGQEPFTCEAPQWTTIEEIIEPYKDRAVYPVYLAKVGNDIRELTWKIGKGESITLLDIRTQAANMAYQASLTLLYLKAVEDVLGRTPVEIMHSLNKGLYTEIRKEGGVSSAELKEVEKAMRDMVKEDITLVRRAVTKQEALEELDSLGLVEKRRLFEHAAELERVWFYELDGFKNAFYCHMLPSTGYLKLFDIRKYRDGVLLRFPHMSDPSRLPDYSDDEKMYESFRSATHWQKLLGIEYVADLNEKIEAGEMKHIIQLSEALHEKRVVEIAQKIIERNKRIVLIAGPSSSGKTSFANRLCIQLEVNGAHPLYMGTDDYFVEREQSPRDENGEYDFENLDALDIDLFNHDLQALLDGEEVDLPTFDFMTGKKVFGKRLTRLGEGQPIVIEGIHALNGELTHKLPNNEKFKIYISALTQLNIDEHDRIPTTDGRLIRRMVRDYAYRGHTPQDTILGWPKVRKGEEKNIFPYSAEADALFNSVHIYELAVLKKYAAPLLSAIGPDDPTYGEARRLLAFLGTFNTCDSEDVIVNNSILREFIGGSVLV